MRSLKSPEPILWDPLAVKVKFTLYDLNHPNDGMYVTYNGCGYHLIHFANLHVNRVLIDIYIYEYSLTTVTGRINCYFYVFPVDKQNTTIISNETILRVLIFLIGHARLEPKGPTS